MPTELNSLRSLPEHFWHTVSASSVNDCTMSNLSPQSAHA
ncbi:Uncharacterised protein [Mycobacteroides abscessus subsp. abscessus]|nr:Uncharacterised protein [Mycobacteroides abscessus subsp. abscessus]